MDGHQKGHAGALSKHHKFPSLLFARTFDSSRFRQVMFHKGTHAFVPSPAGALAKRVGHG